MLKNKSKASKKYSCSEVIKGEQTAVAIKCELASYQFVIREGISLRYRANESGRGGI